MDAGLDGLFRSSFSKELKAYTYYASQRLQGLPPGEYDVNISIDPGNPNSVIYYLAEEKQMYEVNQSNASEADLAVRETLRARREKELLDLKLNLVEQYGADVYENGVVIKFSKRFAADRQMDYPERVYNYAGLKTNNQWYLTGKLLGFSRGTWDNLVLALVGGDFPVHPEDVVVLASDNVTDVSVIDTQLDRANVPIDTAEAPPESTAL
jgi:hypothetical protein